MASDRVLQQQYTPLKAITERISHTPVKQLPTAVPQLVSLLVDCRQILSRLEDSRPKQTPDAASNHKLRTQVTTLLNDRSVEGRWAAAVFIKTIIDVGGYETLHRCGPWVRGLLTNLNKPDPPTSKKLYAITLTRIFTLTHEYPTLVREITTPSLPQFISLCLNILSPKDTSKHKASHALVISTLECLRCLLPRHPSVFRSYVVHLKTTLVAFLSNTSSDSHRSSKGIHTSAQLSESARALFTLLHYCAPKQTSAEEWRKTADLVIAECHKTADKLFRSIIEERDVIPGTLRSTAVGSTIAQEIQQSTQDSALGLQGWTGVYAGAENLRTLLRLLLQLVQSQNASPIPFAIGNVLDILHRVLSICAPARADSKVARGFGYNAKFNDAIGREEREGFLSEIPSLHTVALEVLQALYQRLGLSSMPTLHSTLDLVVWVFSCEYSNPSVRTASFMVVSKILEMIGPSLTKSQGRYLERLMRSCCEELLPTPSDTTSDTTEAVGNGKAITADTFLQNSKITRLVERKPDLKSASERAAAELLVTYLAHVPSINISPRLRAQLDRTAILTSAADAMTASVLNSGLPAHHRSKPHSSILPFLARAHPEHMATEALTKPRLPVIQSGRLEEHKENGRTEHDEDSSDDQNMLDVVQPTTWTSAFATSDHENETKPNPEQQEQDILLEDPAELASTPLQLSQGEAILSDPRQREDLHNIKRQRANDDNGVMSPAKRQHIDERELDPLPYLGGVSTSDSTTHPVLRGQAATTAVPTDSQENNQAVDPINMLPSPGRSATHATSLGPVEASDDDENFEIPTLTMDSDDDDDLEDN